MKTTRSFHPLLVLATAAGLSLATTSAMAQPWQINRNQFRFSNTHSVVDGNIVDVQVRVSGGEAPLFFKPGTSDRHYFQAFQGRNYSLVIRNTTGRRVGVLIAVDGLNVVNGQRSALDRHEPMYVLGPWETAEIQGWRSSMSNVRKFVFVDEERSYAERTGQANGDMGWIRVLAYREVQRQPLWGNWSRPREIRGDERSQLDQNGEESDGGAAPIPGMKSAPAPDSKRSMSSQGYARDESAPGTGWGDREYDPVQQTSFEPMAWAADKIALRYEYASGLRALGIIISRRPRVFERDRGELGFAQPPRW
jgi:hypothetical protein